jgi:hypothetical protein
MRDCHGKIKIQPEEDSLRQQIGLKFKEQTSKMVNLEHGLCSAKTWTLRKVDQIYLGSLEIWR